MGCVTDNKDDVPNTNLYKIYDRENNVVCYARYGVVTLSCIQLKNSCDFR